MARREFLLAKNTPAHPNTLQVENKAWLQKSQDVFSNSTNYSKNKTESYLGSNFRKPTGDLQEYETFFGHKSFLNTVS